MNIFATSKCPIECAKALDDKRVNKMCLETAQMLSTALFYSSPSSFTVVDYTPLKRITGTKKWNDETKVKKAYYLGGTRIYAPTHQNHPANIWTRTSIMNFKWLLDHFNGLLQENYKRRGKSHASGYLLPVFKKYVNLLPKGEFTPFVNCAANKEFNVDFKHIEDTTLAYQMYLNSRWEKDKLTPKWYGVTG